MVQRLLSGGYLWERVAPTFLTGEIMNLKSLFDEQEITRVTGINTTTFKTQDPYGRVIEQIKQYKTKKQAIDEVEANARQEWLDKALKVLRYVALRNYNFTSDDIWQELERQNIEKPRTHSAMGAVLRRGWKTHLCEKSGRYIPSKQNSNHQRDVAQWVSLIYDPSVR